MSCQYRLPMDYPWIMNRFTWVTSEGTNSVLPTSITHGLCVDDESIYMSDIRRNNIALPTSITHGLSIDDQSIYMGDVTRGNVALPTSIPHGLSMDNLLICIGFCLTKMLKGCRIDYGISPWRIPAKLGSWALGRATWTS